MTFPRNSVSLAPLDHRSRSPWAYVGTSVAGTRNARHALEVAGLAGWNVRKVPMRGTDTVATTGATTLVNPDKVMLVYTDPANGQSRYLSTVGKKYGVHQNEEGADVIDTLIAEAGATSAGYAGSLEGGRKTFVTIPLPAGMRIDGVDDIDLHLVVFSSHDGESAFRVMIVPFRVACANQLTIAIRNQKSSVVIRHTRNSTINPEDIRAQLGLLHEYADAFEAEAQRMIRTEMTNAEFNDLIREVWPLEADASAVTRSNDRRRTGQLVRLWTSEPDQAVLRGTRWGAWQAVTAYLDHHAGPSDATARARGVMTSATVATRKQNAFDLLTT